MEEKWLQIDCLRFWKRSWMSSLLQHTPTPANTLVSSRSHCVQNMQTQGQEMSYMQERIS